MEEFLYLNLSGEFYTGWNVWMKRRWISIDVCSYTKDKKWLMRTVTRWIIKILEARVKFKPFPSKWTKFPSYFRRFVQTNVQNFANERYNTERTVDEEVVCKKKKKEKEGTIFKLQIRTGKRRVRGGVFGGDGGWSCFPRCPHLQVTFTVREIKDRFLL